MDLFLFYNDYTKFSYVIEIYIYYLKNYTLVIIKIFKNYTYIYKKRFFNHVINLPDCVNY